MVYLTLAALATQLTGHRRVRHAIVAIAVLLVGTIGVSRVYLGVHWPSDVAAGWCFGTLWALGWWWATAAARRSWGGRASRPVPPSGAARRPSCRPAAVRLRPMGQEQIDDRLRPRQILRRGGEGGVDDRHLGRVDRHHAGKAVPIAPAA